MIKIETKGFEQLKEKFDNLSKDSIGLVQSSLNDFADRTVTDAKNLVSTFSSDEGALLRSLYPIYGQGFAGITSNSKYAAYIEFGTRKFAASYVSTLPAEWQTYANTFRGKSQWGGSLADFFDAIRQWCKRKGIDDKAAYPIAKSILTKGIRQRPFLYPSFYKNLPLLIQDLKDIYK